MFNQGCRIIIRNTVVVDFIIINSVSSDFPSVANQWSVGSHGPYSILKKIRRIHQLHGYDSTGLLIAVLLELSNFCGGEAVMHCPIRGQSIEGFYILQQK